ncbi:AOR [Symbiodinium sp. KB8]|nr:AOR [Symbiodinium sp. KB8]
MRLIVGLRRPRLQSTGTDFAGEVEAIGASVSRFKVGDKVFGFYDHGFGSHAQYIAVAETVPMAVMPKGKDFAEAVAGLEGMHYAFNFVRVGGVQKGQRVLVNGGTGAIGSAAIQLLKYYGTHVTATCRTEHMDLVKSIGADRVIDYTKQDFTEDKEKYDFVFDTVGKSTFGRCRRLLTPHGGYISSELGPWMQNIAFALTTPCFRGRKVYFPFPANIPRSINFVRDRMEDGTFKPVIDRKYPLERLPEAFEYVESGQKVGNVVLTCE